jgi:hypothetical protein
MKITHFSLISICSLLALSCVATAAEFTLDSATINRIEQSDVSGFAKKSNMPVTQFLNIEAGKLADGNLSLHLSGWGRADLADKSYNDDYFSGSLTYAYLKYRFKESGASIRAGRFFVHEGIVNEQLDGLGARTDLPFGFGLSAFGGATVHTRHLYGENSDGKGNVLYGGRANYRYKGMLELGISGVYEDEAPTLVNYSNGNHRLLGGDIWLNPHKLIEIMGHTSYNPETSRTSEHTYLVNVKPNSDLTLSGEFNEQREKSYLYAWTMLSGAALNPKDQSRSMGGSVSYRISKTAEVTANYKHYTRELGNADRYGADIRIHLLGNSLRGGIGYHYLRAGPGFAINSNPSASYHELRAYALHDTKSYFASADIIDYIFANKIYNKQNAWEGIFSLGYHITPTLALSGDISYGRNPQFTEETKGLIRLTYTMTYNSKGEKK